MMKTVPFKTVAYPQLKKALQSSGMTPLLALEDLTGMTFRELFGECEGRR